jgi:hypothetical protein
MVHTKSIPAAASAQCQHVSLSMIDLKIPFVRICRYTADSSHPIALTAVACPAGAAPTSPHALRLNTPQHGISRVYMAVTLRGHELYALPAKSTILLLLQPMVAPPCDRGASLPELKHTPPPLQRSLMGVRVSHHPAASQSLLWGQESAECTAELIVERGTER